MQWYLNVSIFTMQLSNKYDKSFSEISRPLIDIWQSVMAAEDTGLTGSRKMLEIIFCEKVWYLGCQVRIVTCSINILRVCVCHFPAENKITFTAIIVKAVFNLTEYKTDTEIHTKRIHIWCIHLMFFMMNAFEGMIQMWLLMHSECTEVRGPWRFFLKGNGACSVRRSIIWIRKCIFFIYYVPRLYWILGWNIFNGFWTGLNNFQLLEECDDGKKCSERF